MNRDQFIEELQKLGIIITESQIKKLEDFYELLIEWNTKINLTTIVEKEDALLKHFYDSLTIQKVIDLNKVQTLCDVGSGAGFPGIVLKIVYPHLKITLVDSLRKRVDYLNTVIHQLELKEIVAVHSRMENFSNNNKEKFDIITARAVATTNFLTEISIKALKIQGSLILLKGNCEEEIQNAPKALIKLNATMSNIERFQLPYENSNRTILTIIKNEQTPKDYPRTIDKIKKKPL